MKLGVALGRLNPAFFVAVTREGRRLLAFAAADGEVHDVRFARAT